MKSTGELMLGAWKAGVVIPAFNISYLPMMEPIVRALCDTGSLGLITVARCEWEKFEARSLQHVREEYERCKDGRHTRLHLDHVPVIDEDDQRVDYMAIIREAVDLGYESVMIDGSRLPLEENIDATRSVVEIAHAAGIPVEAELGAVLGHEAGPLPPYEELFASGKGFTDSAEAERFVEESGVDWLSVAVGNIHGSISEAARGKKKPEARIHVEHLAEVNQRARCPLVLHGGSGIRKESIQAGIQNGIAKVNIATAVRQAFEEHAPDSLEKACEAVYARATEIISNELAASETLNLIESHT